MATMDIGSFRDQLAGAVQLAKTEAVIVEEDGRPAAVLISPERYDELMTALADAEDVVALEAQGDPGPSIPWEDVQAELGR